MLVSGLDCRLLVDGGACLRNVALFGVEQKIFTESFTHCSMLISAIINTDTLSVNILKENHTKTKNIANCKNSANYQNTTNYQNIANYQNTANY